MANEFTQTLTSKFGPLPVWAWAALGTVILAYIIHRKNAAANPNANGTSAAAGQANSNLGSAAQLANMFEVAGLMPFQGGDVFVNEASPSTGQASNGKGFKGFRPVPKGETETVAEWKKLIEMARIWANPNASAAEQTTLTNFIKGNPERLKDIKEIANGTYGPSGFSNPKSNPNHPVHKKPISHGENGSPVTERED